MRLVRRGNQWPLFPYFDRLRRRFGVAGQRAKQTSLTLFPTAARHGNCESPSEASAPPPAPTGERSPLRNWSALRASPLPPPARTPSAGRSISSARSIDPEPMQFGARAVPLDGEPLSRMRVRLQILLRAVHARIYGAGRRRFRIEDLREAGCGRAGRARPRAMKKSGASTSPLARRPILTSPPRRNLAPRARFWKRMAEREGLSLSITTKSNQVLRDIDLLQANLRAVVAHGEYEQSRRCARGWRGCSSRARRVRICGWKRCGNCAKQELRRA